MSQETLLVRSTKTERLPIGSATPEHVLALLPDLVRQTWRRLLLTAAGAGALAAGGSFLVPQKFLTTATFVPQTSGSPKVPASLAGLAAQFGVAPGAGGFTPNLFAVLPTTRYIREQVALAHYALPPCLGSDSTAGNLILGFGLESDSTAGNSILGFGLGKKTQREALDAAIRKLDHATDVDFDPITSAVTLSVTACSPELASDITSAYLAAIDRFDREVLRSQAREQREFGEQRVKDLAGELSAAEESLVRFYEKNRTYQTSPALQQEETRLRRQITVLESTYLSVRTDYERARMDEARDQPAITIIEPPEPPARKSWPKRWLFGLFGAVAACTVLLGRRLISLQRSS